MGTHRERPLTPQSLRKREKGCPTDLGSFWEGRKEERLCFASMASLGNCKKQRIEET